MANLNVENLNRIVQSGDVERLFTGTAKGVSPENQPPSEAGGSGKTFSEILRDSVDQVNMYQSQADTAVKELVAGRSKNIHETMLTIERADTSLKLAMQVRNKILDAYREIMRMQV
jgi:flagellar hook-basal body complex protein FliE